MDRRLRPALALLTAAALAVPASGCKAFDDVVVAIFGRSMRDQASFGPYENPRPAPEGAVPFASGNYGPRRGVMIGQPEGTDDPPPPFTQAELNSVAAGLENPVEATPGSLERGEELFLRFCAPCHGPDGAGATGYVVPAGMPPFSLTVERVRGYTDGYLYGMVRVGRGLMPAYGDKVAHWDRWHIVNYVRELQRRTAAGGGGGGER